MGLVQFTADLFSRSSSWIFRSPEKRIVSSAELGRWGEKIAAQHLRKNGYRILYLNFRAPHGGEVDLVCRDKKAGALVFVEVKTRRTLDFGDPARAVNAEKQALVSRGAAAWLRLLDFPDVPFRFDIVEVIGTPGTRPLVNILPSAFAMPEHYRISPR